MAESKLLSQSARELYNVNNNNNKDVQVYFDKNVLKEKHVYLALIFLGKKLGGSDKALLAFKIALVSKPNISLAWNCLADYDHQYQDAVSKSNLLSIYIDLLKLKIDDKRVRDVINKVAKIGFSLNDIKSINCLLNYLDRKPAVKAYVIAKYQILDLLKANILNGGNDTLAIESYIARNNFKQSFYNSICVKLGKILLKKKDIVEAFAEVTQCPVFLSSTIFCNWLCKYLCLTFSKYESFQGIDVEKYKDIITAGIKNSKYSNLLNSMILYSKKMYADAFIQYTKVLNYDQVNVTEATHILKCAFKFNKWGFAELLAKHFLIKANDADYIMKLKKVLFISYSEEKKWEEAVVAGEEIPFDSLNLCEQAILAKCYVENGQNADRIIEKLRKTRYYTQLQGLVLMKQGYYMEAIDMFQQNIEDPVNVLYIAKSYWELECFETSYVYIIKAFLLDYENADVRFYLGMYYLNCKNDVELALTCLEKAYQLNNADANIVKSLSDLYFRMNFKHRNLYLLRGFTYYIKDQSWVHVRLGVIYMKLYEWTNAVRQFIKAINIDPNDIEAHENLAEAFYSKRCYKCAINIYFKTIAINKTTKLYYLCRIGHIQSLLKDYNMSIFTFEQILRLYPQNLLALNGIIDTWILVAKSNIETKHYHIARDAAQSAVNYAIRALCIRNYEMKFDFWELMGSAILLIAKLPDDFCFVKIKCRHGNDKNLLNLGTLYIRSNMYRLGNYLLWRGKYILPPDLLLVIDREMSNDLFDAEESADLFRYSCAPDLGLRYSDWVAVIHSRCHY